MGVGAGKAAFLESDFARLAGEVVQRFSVFHTHGDVACLKGWTPGNEPLFIKFFNGSEGRRIASAEYRALLTYFEGMRGSASVRCPKPVALLESDGGGAVLCEWTDARRGDSFFKLFMPFEFLRRRGIAGAGEWLGAFHRVSGISERPLREVLDGPALMADLERLFADRRHGVDQSRLASFAAALRAAEASPVPCTKLHSDYTPSNIFITRREVVGFDFTAEATGPAMLDIGTFLTALIWYGYFNPRMSAGQKFREDCALFLSAYTRQAGPSAPWIHWIFLVKALADLADKLGRDIAAGRKRKITKERHRARVLRVLADMLAQ